MPPVEKPELSRGRGWGCKVQVFQQLLTWLSGGAELGLGWEDLGGEAPSNSGRIHPRESTMERWVFVEVDGSLLIPSANTLDGFLLMWCEADKQQASPVACSSCNSASSLG